MGALSPHGNGSLPFKAALRPASVLDKREITGYRSPVRATCQAFSQKPRRASTRNCMHASLHTADALVSAGARNAEPPTSLDMAARPPLQQKHQATQNNNVLSTVATRLERALKKHLAKTVHILRG